ncbi:MAG: type III pantothenate kinase [Candidatus Krumholzibacteriia bacterium]
MASGRPVLFVDAGNSFVKFAARDGRAWSDLGRTATSAAVSARRVIPPGARRYVDRRRDVETWVSSVVPGANRPVAAALRALTGSRPVFVDHRFRLPFRLHVAKPGELGADRLCAAAGAVRRGRRSVIVIDVGSAITVDLVDRGAYRGGLILVGPALGLRTLGAYARRLPTVDLPSAPHAFPQLFENTRSSMILGARVGALGAVREAAAVLRRAAGGRPGVVVTGGGVVTWTDRLPAGWRFEPRLVCEGLLLLRRLNPERRPQ